MSIFNNSLTMRTMDMLEQGLNAATLRRSVLANNISNVSVPHFKRSEVVFESELKRAIDSERHARENSFALRTTHEKHIPITPFQVRDFRAVKPSVHIDYLSKVRNDGNNIDMESEFSKVVRNQLHYSMMTNRMGGTFRQLNQLTRLA